MPGTRIITLLSSDGRPFRIDIQQDGTIGYHPGHQELFLAKLVVALAEGGGLIIRQFLPLRGDVNLPSQRSPVWDAFTPASFLVPPALADDPGSDLARGKRYDRVRWKSRGGERFTGQAGAVDFYAGSYRELFPGRRLTKEAFTFQMSDHLPLWVEVATG